MGEGCKGTWIPESFQWLGDNRSLPAAPVATRCLWWQTLPPSLGWHGWPQKGQQILQSLITKHCVPVPHIPTLVATQVPPRAHLWVHQGSSGIAVLLEHLVCVLHAQLESFGRFIGAEL